MTEQAMPAFASITKMPAGGFATLPDSPNPYYVAASDGLFVHRRLLFGRGVAKLEHWPANFAPMNATHGHFLFDAAPIPGALMSQIVHFFRRIYEKQKTEAAVLLLMHRETKAWRVFVPTQLVSHGGVNYVFDPAHISRDWMVVGTIHSHCDFSAFHSGTDTGDAADFDGFHATVGFIMRETPQIVAMVAMNKQFLHYKEDQFASLFDYSQLWTAEAPAWWDRYVGPSNGIAKPVGFELYTKFEKPTVVKTHATGITYSPGPSKPSSAHAITPWWQHKTKEWLADNGYVWEDKYQTYMYNIAKDTTRNGDYGHRTYSQPLRESEEFNSRQRGAKKSKKRQFAKATRTSRPAVEIWEDGMTDRQAEAIWEANVLTEEEWDEVFSFPEVWSDEAEWKPLFVNKLFSIINVLGTLGVEARITFADDTTLSTTTQQLQLLGAGDHAP